MGKVTIPATVLYYSSPRTIYVHQAKTFAVNYSAVTADGSKFVIRANSIKHPAELVFMVDGIGGAPTFYTSSGDFFDYPQNYALVTPTPRHSGQFNMLFFDGHGASGAMGDYQRLTGEQLRRWRNVN